MKIAKCTVWAAVMITMLLTGLAFAQATGDYRSAANGNWSDPGTWETFDGANWVAATTAPTGTETITVDNTDTVQVDIAVTVTGYIAVQDQGQLEVTDGSLTFEDGSTYEHARDDGSIPESTWNQGSTLLLTGTEQDAPGNRNQDFYNVTFNTPNLGRNRDMGWNGNTIGGDVTVISTGSNRWQMSSVSAGDTASFTIMGDVIVQDGNFAVQGTGNALTVFEVHHFGNIEVTGGNFSVARGSQGSGSGSTTWFLYQGNFTMSNATTQNSNPTPGNAKFVFTSADTQTLALGEGNTLTNLSIEVSDSTTLDVGDSELDGSGIFVLNDGATLVLAHLDGVGGLVDALEDTLVSLSSAANYVFNGTSAQVTSTHMPTTVNDLTIDNEAGVVLSQETTINGVLRLVAGEFDNTIPFTLGPEGSVSFEGGSLKFPVSVAEVPGLPTEFALQQNYPNPFNPATTIRYDVPARAHVTLRVYDIIGREIAELVNGQIEAGVHEAVWDARDVASGVYFYRISAGDFTAVRKLVLMK